MLVWDGNGLGIRTGNWDWNWETNVQKHFNELKRLRWKNRGINIFILLKAIKLWNVRSHASWKPNPKASSTYI